MKRRSMVVVMVLGILLGTAAPALADEAGGGNRMPGWSVHWKATSPSIHKGDRYTLLMTNTSDEAQKARVRTIIMDHSTHTNTDAIDEQVELAPGEEREFTAVNDYGDANHFSTIIGSETRDLALAVSVADADGTETARFNEKAFLAQDGTAKGGAAKGEKAHGHAHDGGLTALTETARLAPLSLGVLATTGFGLYTARRRRSSWSAVAGAPTEPVALSSAWRGAAVVGLALSGALHMGLTPAHFEEAAVQGIFFCAAGVAAVVLAAAILVWPSRLAYLAGAALSLALIVLWAVFLLVPPPGAEASEAVDAIGLFTKATELVAALACTALWSQAPRGRKPDQTVATG